MEKDNLYPVFQAGNAADTAAKQRQRGGIGGFGKAILAIVIGFPVVIFVGFKIIDWSRTNEYSSGGVTCDKAGPRHRLKWLDEPNRLRPDRATPRQLGFDVIGDECVLKIMSRQMSCDDATVIPIERDDPFLKEARSIGFSTYVCEPINGGGRREFSMARILGGAAGDSWK